MHLSKLLSQSAERYAQRPAFVVSLSNTKSGFSALTYTEALYASKWHQQWIESHVLFLKNKPGTIFRSTLVVAYLSSNSSDFLLSLLASMALDGVLPVLLNTRWTALEMADALSSGVNTGETKNAKTLLLFGPQFYNVAEQVAKLSNHNVRVMALPEFSRHSFTVESKLVDKEQVSGYSSIVDSHRRDTRIDEMIRSASLNATKQEMEDAVIVFTSGTSGGAKGVRLSHNALYIQAMSKLHSPCCYDEETKMLATTVPLFHVGGLSSVLAVLIAGGSWIFPQQIKNQKGFDPIAVIHSLSNPTLHLPTTLVVVPAMLQSVLANAPKHATYDSVRLILIGGQSASPKTLKQSMNIFPRARVVQTFACTEAASSLTFLHINDRSGRVQFSRRRTPPGDCVGFPPNHVNICVFDQNNKDRILTDPFQVGIIATRGHHVMNGYWNRNDSRDNVFPRHQWLLTNDLGFLDDSGRLYFCGRVKDVIRTGGETVWASEVERVILQHPHVRECAVFALKDERLGEAVSVAIACSQDQSKGSEPLGARQIREFCSSRGLAGYKRPRNVYFLNELPRNSSGKVLKHVLIDRFASKDRIESKL